MNLEAVKRIREEHVKRFGSTPRVFRSPGRVNLIGEHTDYNDGFVLPAGVDKEVVFAVSKNSTQSEIHLYAIDLDEEFSFTIDSISPSEKEWPNYLIGIVEQLLKLGKKLDSGLDCVFGGDVPLGAGMSSSAAIECCFAYSINQLFDLNLDQFELVKLSQKAENEFVGVNCGIMDQFASVFSKADHVVRLDCRTLEHEYFKFNLDHYKIVLVDTQVKHSLASSEYNTRRQECEQGVELMKNHYPDVNSLRDVNTTTLANHQGEFEPIVYKRCSYVVGEIERTIRACEKLVDGDIIGFGKEMYETHDGLSKDYEVSCAELDFLVDFC